MAPAGDPKTSEGAAGKLAEGFVAVLASN